MQHLSTYLHGTAGVGLETGVRFGTRAGLGQGYISGENLQHTVVSYHSTKGLHLLCKLLQQC